MDLPDLRPDEADILDAMRALLEREIQSADGALPFDRYMELALYARGLGYYVNERRKFGEGGDFVTAPEVSPLFGTCVANQVAECLHAVDGATILEFGAGSGRLAADVLLALDHLDALPARYAILELSPALQAQQHATLASCVPKLLPRVEWWSALPDEPFTGVVLGNEVLDAMPVHGFRRVAGHWQERFVVLEQGSLCDDWRAAESVGLEAALNAMFVLPQDVADGFESEINLRLQPWLRAVSDALSAGCILLIDYGYTQREYYHPQRNRGTLMCHFRHRAYADPYRLPGLQDMTSNVDFTAVARAAVASGLRVAGYTTQTHFLLDSGLDAYIAQMETADTRRRLQSLQAVKRLTLPNEMGERFKAIALTRGIDNDLSGFRSRDLRGRL